MEKQKYISWEAPSCKTNISYPSSPLNQEEISTLFSESIIIMHQIATSKGLSLPPNFQQRLLLLSGVDYYKFNQPVPESYHGVELGTVLADRTCIVNVDSAKAGAKQLKIKYTGIVQETGIHELWHSLGCMEFWIPSDQEFNISEVDLKMLKRGGIAAKKPGDITDIGQGLGLLEEGFTEYLTCETLKVQGLRLRTNTYKGQLKIVNLLAARIGMKPFFDAHFQKDGLSSLAEVLKDYFGKSSLRELALAVYYDYATDHASRIYGFIKLPSKAESYIKDEGSRQSFKFFLANGY